MIENEIDYLSEEVEMSLIPAGHGKRFANLILDYLFMYFIMVIVFVVMANLGIFFKPSNGGNSQFTFLFLGWLIYVLTLFGLEVLLKGKSIGKLITRTRAVNEIDGSYINVKTALFRSLIRTVPFELFSALGSPCRPWHDKWTNTVVVNN